MVGLKPAEFSDAEKGAHDLTPDQEEQLKEVVHEAGLRARSEGQMVATQAQRLFYEYWNAGGHDAPLQDGITQFKKCINMAEEIRKVVTQNFAVRVKRLDEALRKKYSGTDGISRIIQVGSKEWESWRLPEM